MKDEHSHTSSIIDEQVAVVVFVSGYKSDDTAYYAYVMMAPSKFAEYQKVKDQGDFDLASFGEIIKWGEGLEPSEDVKKEMKEKYNCSDDFEDKLKEAVTTALKNETD